MQFVVDGVYKRKPGELTVRARGRFLARIAIDALDVNDLVTGPIDLTGYTKFWAQAAGRDGDAPVCEFDVTLVEGWTPPDRAVTHIGALEIMAPPTETEKLQDAGLRGARMDIFGRNANQERVHLKDFYLRVDWATTSSFTEYV